MNYLLILILLLLLLLIDLQIIKQLQVSRQPDHIPGLPEATSEDDSV